MNWKTLVGFTILFHIVVYITRKSCILRLDTKKLNKCINGISTKRIRKYFRLWFRLGSYVTIFIGFPFTLWLFLRTIFYAILPFLTKLTLTAVTQSPTALFTSSIDGTIHENLELHQDDLSPFPDADIPISDSSPSPSSSSYLAIQPILPGWNLPLDQLPYYLLAILISVVIHELGHAIASASHRIPIVSMGISLFGPLIPAAHVELNSAQLREVHFKKQLDILTAGVWMNMYLSLITYFVVPWFLPFILLPTHGVGQGISVTGVVSSSGAGGPGGLERGDIIFGVEDCSVSDVDVWLTCLERIWESDPVGHCLDSATVVTFLNTSENPDCCSPNQDVSPTHLCFLQTLDSEKSLSTIEDNAGSPIIPPVPPISANSSSTTQNTQLPDLSPDLSLNKSQNHSSFSSVCLPAKPIVTLNQTISPKCYTPTYTCPKPQNFPAEERDSDINEIGPVIGSEVPLTSSRCYVAQILKQYPSFRIVQIHRRQAVIKDSVLFVGDVWDLRNGVHVSDYVPRDWWLVRIVGFPKFARIPVHLETVLLLTAGLSAGLAVVNMLPIYGLDGYHVVEALLRVGLEKTWEYRKISRLVTFISWAAVAVALLTVGCSIAQNW